MWNEWFRMKVFMFLSCHPQHTKKRGRTGGGGSPREQGAGGVREAGEERAGSGRSKRAGSGREMRNANFFNSTMHYNTFKNKNPKYI